MLPTPPEPPTGRRSDGLSLDAVGPGEAVQIRSILFDAVRARCRALGIAEGDSLRLRDATDTHLFLETDDGRALSLQRDAARFIHVAREASRRRYHHPRGPLPAY